MISQNNFSAYPKGEGLSRTKKIWYIGSNKKL